MPITLAPIALWRIAESLLSTLIALFGTPEELAGRLIMKRGEHKLTSAWLRTAEGMLRRLIFIEAQAYQKPNTPPPTPRAPRLRRAHTPERTFKLDESFRVIAGAPRKATKRKRRTPREKPRFDYVSVGGLAGRFTALVRAFNDPAAYAKRLARRLHADQSRVFTLLRWLRPPGHGHAEDWAEAEGHALAEATAHFVNSG